MRGGRRLDQFTVLAASNVKLRRRHLTTKQKAFAGARMHNLQHGGDRRSEDFKSPNGDLKIPLTLSMISEILHASERQISRATQILKHEEIREKVEGGKVARARVGATS